MKLYAIYDVKAESYGPVFGVAHDAVAVREFVAAMDHPQSVMAKYPEDFELHCLGKFHQTSAEGPVPIVGDVPMVVTTAQVVLAARQPQDGQLSLIKEA